MLTSMLVRSVRKKARTGLASIMPPSFRAVAAKKAVNAPHMKTSPWAKLIMKRMPYTSV